MSSHFVDRKSPPPGLSSFTKIRLGWIIPEEVRIVQRGATDLAFLSPLAQGGNNLAVKIPLPGREFYLVENRRKIGFDGVLPDSGILILKVNPEATEGSGTVKVMDANPAAPNFSHATFRMEVGKRNLFKDKENNVAIIPLWSEGATQGVLITSTAKSAEAVEAASKIQEMMKKNPEPRDGEADRRIKDAIDSFKNSIVNN